MQIQESVINFKTRPNAMNLHTLKIVTAISGMLVCFPGETVTMPLAANALVFLEGLYFRLFITPIITYISFVYLILSAAYRFKSLLDDILTTVILLALLCYIGAYATSFIRYANWVSTITVLLTIVLAVKTIIETIRRVR